MVEDFFFNIAIKLGRENKINIMIGEVKCNNNSVSIMHSVLL